MKLSPGTLPGVEAIGAGINPFAGYATPLSIVSHPFDWGKADSRNFTYLNKSYDLPQPVNANSLARSSISEISGQSIQTFQENLANSVSIGGSYNFFSGSLDVDISKEFLTSSDRCFSRVQQSVALWSLQLTFDANIRKYLKPNFQQALDMLDHSDGAACYNFLTTYGSHVLTGITIGGSAVRTAATLKASIDEKFGLSVTAKASFSFATAQATAEDKTDYSTAVKNFNSNSSIAALAVGGDATLVDEVFSDQSSFSEWSASVIDQPIFVDFLTQNPLQPIWNLCTNDSTGQAVSLALQKAYSQWAHDQSLKFTYQPDYIVGLKAVSGNDSLVPGPSGYTKVPQDLNASVGGEYIYLCYLKQKVKSLGSNAQAVTDIKVIYGENIDIIGYKKVQSPAGADMDFNKGAKGDYVGVCYKVEDYSPETAILDIDAVQSSRSDGQPPPGFIKVDGDLNAGASGDYIYLGVRKQGAN